MKYCPICQTRYDEEIMRFCTKDGTPLIDEAEPNFTQMPSESSEYEAVQDDSDEETVIRRNAPVSEAAARQTDRENSQKLVVPIVGETEEPPVRTKTTSYTRQQPMPQKSNTAWVVLATMLGTILVLGGAVGAYWLLNGYSGEESVNANSGILNANQDTNLNTNLPIDNSLFNINADTNLNANVNTNVNANIKTPSPTPSPTPTPTRTPSPTPSPTPDDEDDGRNTNANTSNSTTLANTKPTVTPAPRATPTVPPANTPINVGNMNSRAVSLIKPPYPSAARALRASGQVVVQVLVDESGRVLSANALSGHPLLRQAAENAARSSRFNPVRVSGQTVRTAGTVIYNFVDN